MSILKYTKRAYPFYYEELKRVFLVLCIIAATSFLFSYLFEPFEVNIDEDKIPRLWILMLHATLPIPIAFVYLFFLRKSVKYIENWTIGKEFFHLAIVLLLIGIAGFLIRDVIYDNPNNWSFQYLLEEIRNTFLIGCLLLAILLPLNLQRLLYKHEQTLKSIPTNQQHYKDEQKTVQIQTPISEEKFELDIHSFLFAKVEGNYTELVFGHENGFQKSLKRLTLKELELQLEAFSFIFKTHRSYLVNLKKVDSIKGNAQGYVLQLETYSEGTVPVSRSKISLFKSAYTALKN